MTDKRAAVNRVKSFCVALCVALLATACDKAQLLAPAESTVTLTAAAPVLSASGSTLLTAYVQEPSGTPVQNGTTVRFTTSIGRLESVEAQTRNGVATTTLHADGANGVATVRAQSGGAVSDDVEIGMGTGAVDTVEVRATPSSVGSGGGAVTISASVTGANNRGLAGVPVSFSTTAGTLSATTATTDASGDATVTLTTNRAATVTARVGAESDTVDISVINAASIALATSPTSPTAGQTVSLTVTPTIPTGGSAPTVVVTWGDGSSTNLGLLTSARTVTHAFTAQGTYVITATATEGDTSSSTSATVNVGAPPSVVITAAAATGTTNTTFSFTVTPATTNGVRSVTVDFGDNTSAIELGTIASATTVTHRFGTAGNYTVRATQVDSLGNTSTGVVVVTVTTP